MLNTIYMLDYARISIFVSKEDLNKEAAYKGDCWFLDHRVDYHNQYLDFLKGAAIRTKAAFAVMIKNNPQ